MSPDLIATLCDAPLNPGDDAIGTSVWTTLRAMVWLMAGVCTLMAVGSIARY